MKSKVIKEKIFLHDDEYYYKIIRRNIKRIRLSKGLTQQDLADMTDLSREYICDIENDSRNKHLTIAVLGRIADAMNVHIANFFIEENERKWNQAQHAWLNYGSRKNW